MILIWFVVGGSLFCLLGLLHAIYTLADMAHPRRLVPEDPCVLESMRVTGLRLARGGTTMWRAWVGFNLSHSIGAVIFGSACIAIGLATGSFAVPKAALLTPAIIGLVYLWLALRYWFRIPAIGIGIATLCLATGWLLY